MADLSSHLLGKVITFAWHSPSFTSITWAVALALTLKIGSFSHLKKTLKKFTPYIPLQQIRQVLGMQILLVNECNVSA